MALKDDVFEHGPDPVEEDPDTGEVRRVSSDDEPGMLVPAAAGEFPAPPEAAAFEGLLEAQGREAAAGER